MSEEETQGEIENVIKHNQAEIMAENLQLKTVVDGLEAKIVKLATDLKAATEQLEEHTRSKKIDRILKVSDLGLGFLAEKSLADLDEIEELYKHAKKPFFRSTGDSSRYASEYDEKLYQLNNMFKFGKK